MDSGNNLLPQPPVLSVPRHPYPRAASVKAIDFGSSQILGTDPHKRSTRRTGTPAFMAPEVYARDYGLKADIWSAGVTLYYLYCHKLPFAAGLVGAKGIDDVAKAVVANVAIPYDFGEWENISSEGMDFIMQCLERSEEHRMSAKEALYHPWLVEAARRAAGVVAVADISALETAEKMLLSSTSDAPVPATSSSNIVTSSSRLADAFAAAAAAAVAPFRSGGGLFK